MILWGERDESERESLIKEKQIKKMSFFFREREFGRVRTRRGRM
jgi:hypothetical protein